MPKKINIYIYIYVQGEISSTLTIPSVGRTIALSKARAFVFKQRLFLTLKPDDIYTNKAYIHNEA